MLDSTMIILGLLSPGPSAGWLRERRLCRLNWLREVPHDKLFQ